MTITANDADEGIFAEITYDIVEQSPSQGASFFSINKETGQIFVKLNTLDREVIIWLLLYWATFRHAVGLKHAEGIWTTTVLQHHCAMQVSQSHLRPL